MSMNTQQLNNPQHERQKVYDYCVNMLGGSMVDVELDPSDLETALDRAITRFRQRSSNSVEESYSFLQLIENQNDYILPEEIINVQSVFRRSLGSGGTGNGANFDPFTTAATNTYLLNSTMLGGIATYFLYANYQEQIGKMFGSYIEFQWINYSRTLRILQRPRANGEILLLRCQNYRPDFVLINDLYAKQWIRDYSLAVCKLILGEARSKHASIIGPQGGTQLNGPALLQAGAAEMEKLDKEIETYMAGGTGLTFILG
jgi:hypothetical protein